MSATEFFFGKGKREFRVAGVITIKLSGTGPNKREIGAGMVKKLFEKACLSTPWEDDEYPSPRGCTVDAVLIPENGEEDPELWIGERIRVTIRLHDELRQSQLRPFARYIRSIADPLCEGELEYLQRYYELEATAFLGFGVWG